MRFGTTLTFAASLFAGPAFAQQQPIAYVPVDGVSISGSLSVADGRASIGNDGTITAGDSTAQVRLARGGELRLCASTKVHLSRDSSVSPADPAADTALMIALDRGAIEASYTPGKFSDVLLTPDLRILISGPGQADLKVRTNQKGDTCIDNHGPNAPYITVTSQFEGGLYRVQPNQRVMFEHGDISQVVDNESEPCGCPSAPPPVSVASTTPGILMSGSTAPAPKAVPPVGGPSSTPADTAFPLAQSEGLKPPPLEPTEPAVPVGIPHVKVEAPITYDAKLTPNPAAPGAAGPPPPTVPDANAAPQVVAPEEPAPPVTPVQPAAPPGPPPAKHKSGSNGGVFHALGRFFSHLFGRP